MIGSLVVAVVAVIVGIATLLCGSGVIKRNPVVGIRVPAFFASEEAWTLGHRVAAVPVGLAACVCIGLTFVAASVPSFGGPVAVIVGLIVLLIGVIVGAVIGTRTVHRAG